MAPETRSQLISSCTSQLNAGNLQEVIACVEHEERIGDVDHRLRYLKALGLLRLSQMVHAAAELRKLLQDDPKNPLAQRLQSEVSAAPAVGPNLRLFQVLTFSARYLDELYSRFPHLHEKSFDEQMRVILRDGFAAMHLFAEYLRPFGFETHFVVGNCAYAQFRWALENNVPVDPASNWIYDIVRAQIEAFNPDILYSSDTIFFDDRFILNLPTHPRLVTGWRAAPIDDGVSWRGYDLIISHLKACRDRAPEIGAAATEHFLPGFPAFINDELGSVNKEFDVVFSGQWTDDHVERNRLIQQLCGVVAAGSRNYRLGIFLSVASANPLPPEVELFNQGPRWGIEMHRVLASARIVLNAEIDLARGEAGNMRLFEATGTGAFLLTEHHDNIGRYFIPGCELETFRNAEEMIAKIDFYLAHDAERERIARCGQQRCLSEHGMEKRSREFAQLMRRYLDYKERPMSRDALTRDDNGTVPLTRRMESALEQRKYQKVIDLSTEVSPTSNPSKGVGMYRAVALMHLGRLKEASDSLTQELVRYPDNYEASEMLSKLASLTGPTEHTASAVAPSIHPSATTDDVLRLINECVSWLQRGDGVSAMRTAERAALLGIFVPGLHYLRAICLNAVGRHEEALVAVSEELRLNPDNQEARAEHERLSKALDRRVRPRLNPEQRSYGSMLNRDNLRSIQNASHSYSYRGVPMIKNPFDFALYPLLLWETKPRTVIEIGSKNGGSALWLGDMMNNFDIPGHVYSIDIVRVADQHHPRVTFLEGSGLDLGATLSVDFMAKLERPLLVIEDANHRVETCSAVLNFFHPYLAPGEYIVIEDGIGSDLEDDSTYSSGPHLALKDFFARHPGEYDVDERFTDFFGYNYTWCTNGFLRKKEWIRNAALPLSIIEEFNTDDPTPRGVQSPMSVNERFQLYSAVRNVARISNEPLRVVDVGSSTGASLALAVAALRRTGEVKGFAVEPAAHPGFAEILETLGTDISLFTIGLATAPVLLSELFQSERQRTDVLTINCDRLTEDYTKVVSDYYQLLAPGGVMITFSSALGASVHTNREKLEATLNIRPLELPLLYPGMPVEGAGMGHCANSGARLRVYRKPSG